MPFYDEWEFTLTVPITKISKKGLSLILGLEKYEVTAWLHPRKKNRGLKRRKRKYRKETNLWENTNTTN